MTFLLNTFLGFLLAQLWDILSRNKATATSPQKFDIGFFLKDTWKKIVVSLMLSFTMSLLLKMNFTEFAQLVGKDWTDMNNLAYIAIGFAPELLLQWLKRKVGFLQTSEVDGYTRK